jgi:hypothetical protein
VHPNLHLPHLHLPHLSVPHLPLPAVLLSVVYAAALAVAVANPGRPTLAGLVVLAGLTARAVLRHRQRVARPAVDAVLPIEAPATAPAAAAA